MIRKIIAGIMAFVMTGGMTFADIAPEKNERQFLYFNGPVEIELEAKSDAAEIDFFTWSFVNLDGSKSEWNDIKAEAEPVQNEPGVFKGKAQIPETDGLKGYIIFTATDMSGNTSKPMKRENEIIVTDLTAPLVACTYFEVEPVGSMFEKAYKIKDFFNSKMHTSIEVYEQNFNPDAVKIEILGTNLKGEEVEVKCEFSEWQTDGDRHNMLVSFDGDAIYNLSISCTDLAGNATEENTEMCFTVDTTPPEELSISYSKPISEKESSLYYDDAPTVTLSCADPMSEIAFFRYRYFDFDERKSCEGIVENEIRYVGERCHATLEYPNDWEQMKGYFEIQAVNAAGLESCWFSDTRKIIIDNAPPYMHLERNAPSSSVRETDYYSFPAEYFLQISEDNFFPENIKIRAEKDEEMIDIKPSWNGNECTFSFEEDGRYRVFIEGADRSGNVMKSFESRLFVIDTHINEPGILVEENECDGRSFRDEIIPYIFFNDDNFDSFKIELLQTKMDVRNHDVTSLINIDSIRKNETGFEGYLDIFEHSKEIDGIYTLTVTATDLAGHMASKSAHFTVNRFGSVFVIDEYLESITGRYIKAVNEDLYINEYNPDEVSSWNIDVTKDGKPFKTKAEREEITNNVNEWKEYRYGLYKESFAEDGIYKIKIFTDDAAGNISGSIDEDISFCVDKTAPELINLTGLEKKIINNTSQKIKFSVYDGQALKEINIYVNNELKKQIKNFENKNTYEGVFDLTEKPFEQHIRFLFMDQAGNIFDSDEEDFSPEKIINTRVTLSSDFFVRWYADKIAFWGSITIEMAAMFGLIFIIRRKRKIQK